MSEDKPYSEYTNKELTEEWDTLERVKLAVYAQITELYQEVKRRQTLSTGASPVKPDGSAGLSESRVTQTDPEKQLGLHDGINQKPK